MGEDQEAIAVLEKMLPSVRLDVEWEQTIADEAITLLHMLKSDPVAAHRTLEANETYTLRKLGLERFR